MFNLERQLMESLGLMRRPVAVSFMDAAPDGVEKFEGRVPAGCSFWRLASEGRTFFTAPSDHFNCPIGSYTHHISPPETRAAELPQMLNLMTQIGYIKMEEVPGIPTLEKQPNFIVYAPLGDAPAAADVVIVAGKPGKIMLLVEASGRAGVMSKLPLMARPTCMALPAAMAGGTVTSAGCIGNRVYTEIGDEELYAVISGKDLARLSQELQTVVAANGQLADFHRGRRAELS